MNIGDIYIDIEDNYTLVEVTDICKERQLAQYKYIRVTEEFNTIHDCEFSCSILVFNKWVKPYHTPIKYKNKKGTQ